MMATKGVELASAYIALSVETSQVPKQVQNSLSGLDKYGAAAGRDIGRRMASGVTDTMSRAGKDAGGEFTSSFKTELNGEGRRTATRFTGDLEAQSDKSGHTAGKRFSDSFKRSAKPDVAIDVRSSVKDSGSDAGDSFMSGFGGAIAGLGSRGGPIATAIVAGGLAGIKILGPQISAAMDQALRRDMVQARLGVDPTAIAKIDRASKDAFVNNWGASIADNMDTATSAIQSDLITATSSDKDIQKTIEQLTSVSTLLGEDIPSVSRSASQAIKTGMAKDLTGALDLLVKAQQNGLNVSGDLLDTLNEYSTQFRKLGLDGPEAMALISQAVKGGARDTDIAADALKEFSIRAVDGSETTRDAFTSMGFDADAMAEKFAAGGQSAHDALGQVLTALRNIKDPVEQARVGAELFGTQYEDLGAAANKFDLSTAVNEFGRVKDASQQAADTMSSNAANEWAEARNRLVAYASDVREAWNMANWGDTIPKAINDWLSPDPTLQPGAPGVPGNVGTGPGAAVSPPGGAGATAPGLNPLDVITGASSNPTNANTGGKLTPETQNIQSYLRNSLGFKGTIGGWRPPDGFNEHSSGKASDVMVSSAAEGNALLPNLLRQPGVQYILWNQRQWNPDGTSSPMEDRGSPTQNHMDHLHVKTYDTGGWLPPGITPVNNATGQHELILNPEQQKLLQEQGIDPNMLLQGQIDPNTTQHGQAQGAPPGPQAAKPPASNRTGGYIPATAGNTAPVGQGGLSSILGLGESFINNLIDTGAQAASMAATAAAGAASFGAGAAAGPAASTAISMGAEAAKRGVQWGFDMAGIWGEALPEIFMPFGVPRWLGSVDPMAFVPQIPGQQPGQPGGGAAAQAIQGWAQPGNPAMANGTGQQGAQAALSAAKTQPSYGQTQPPTQPTQQTAPINPLDPTTWMNFGGIFDQGGMLQPNTVGINLSKKPEAVFTQKQLADMQKATSSTTSQGGKGDTIQFYAQDVDSMFREYMKSRRRESRQYSGRP